MEQTMGLNAQRRVLVVDDELINREWRTRTTAKASGGRVAFRGFKGRYRLTWKDADGVGRSRFAEVR